MSTNSRIYRRKGSLVWHAAFYVEGRRVQRSTQCTDKKAAELVLRQWERDAADPAGAAARTATLIDALNLLVQTRDEQAKAGRKSAETVEFYRKKSGHWVCVLGEGFLLAKLDAPVIDGYVSQRRGEEAGDSTIHKELTTLRAALKLAKRAKLWRCDPDEVFPVDLSKKNHDDLTAPSLVPRILVVFVMPEDEAEWLSLTQEALVLRRCAYWRSLRGEPAVDNGTSRRVYLSRKRTFDPDTLRRLLLQVAREEGIAP